MTLTDSDKQLVSAYRKWLEAKQLGEVPEGDSTIDKLEEDIHNRIDNLRQKLETHASDDKAHSQSKLLNRIDALEATLAKHEANEEAHHSKASEEDLKQQKRRLHVVGEDDTFQEVHDSLGDEWLDHGLILCSADYRPAKEEYPITIGKRVKVLAGNYTCFKPPEGTDAVVIDMGVGNNPPGPQLEGFAISGGKNGIRLESGRFTILQNIDINGVEENGIHIRDKGDTAVNSHHFYSVTADGNQGHGFYIGSGAHAVNLHSCQGRKNGGDGAYFADDAYAGGIWGGSYELNEGSGVNIDGANATTVRDTYVEANAKPQIHVHNGALNTTIDSLYFNGFNENVGVKVDSAHATSVSNILARRLNDLPLIKVTEQAKDTDVHAASHKRLDAVGPIYEDAGERTRSDGVLVPQSLRDVEGKYYGDMGIHLDDDGTPRMAFWVDDQWHAQARTQPL